jgi:hypothetical protein
MCISRQKLMPILQKRAARSYCSLLPRRFAFSTNHLQRRLGFFTSPVEINKFRPDFLEWQKFASAINVKQDHHLIRSRSESVNYHQYAQLIACTVGRSMVRIEKGGKLHD